MKRHPVMLGNKTLGNKTLGNKTLGNRDVGQQDNGRQGRWATKKLGNKRNPVSELADNLKIEMEEKNFYQDNLLLSRTQSQREQGILVRKKLVERSHFFVLFLFPSRRWPNIRSRNHSNPLDSLLDLKTYA